MKMEVSDSLSRRIMNMGVVAIVLIVCGHYGWHVTNRFESISYALIKAIWRFATPAFFVTSGFFLARRTEDAGWWKRECVKRVRSLLVPYFVWSLIGVLVIGLLTVAANCYAGRDLLFAVRCHSLQLVTDMGLNPCRLPFVGPLWYLRALFVLVLLSPVIKRFNGIWWLAGVFVVYGLVCPRGEDLSRVQAFFRISLSLEGLFYFSLGYYLYSHNVSMSFCRSMVGFALGLLGMILFVILQSRYNSVHIYLVRWASIPLVLQGVWHLVPDWKLPNVVVRGTFPAYLIHVIVILTFKRVGVMRYCCVNLATSVLIGLFIWFLSAIVIPCIMRKLLPRFSSIAFGGRG